MPEDARESAIYKSLEKFFLERFGIDKKSWEEHKEKLRDYEKELDIDLEPIAERIREEFGDIIKQFFVSLVHALVLVIYHYGRKLGYALGVINSALECGKLDARAEFPCLPPDPTTIAQAWVRREIDHNELEAWVYRNGLSSEAFEVYKVAVRNILSQAEIIDAYLKKVISRRDAKERLRKLGYEEDEIEVLLNSAFEIPAVGELLDFWFKGYLTDEELVEKLKQRGYSDEDIARFMESAWEIPSISDLIHMMVRDAFNERVVQKYGYDEEYPEKIEEWFIKRGMKPWWAKYYWRAHWELPSPTMAYEMFRRGLITEEELDDLLKIADYPRYWREKMIELAYELPTRVDIRRMYDLSIIDEKQVWDFYLMLGYKPEVAVALTEYTVVDTISEERNKLRNQLLEDFELGLISEAELRQALKDLRFNERAIDVIVEAKKLEIERDRVKAKIEVIHEKFLQGVIDANQATSELAKLGISLERVETLVEKWIAEKMRKHKRLTLRQIQELYRKRIIDDERVLEELKESGYSEEDAEVLLKLIQKGGQLE
jgi:hypothetical protein